MYIHVFTDVLSTVCKTKYVTVTLVVLVLSVIGAEVG